MWGTCKIGNFSWLFSTRMYGLVFVGKESVTKPWERLRGSCLNGGRKILGKILEGRTTFRWAYVTGRGRWALFSHHERSQDDETGLIWRIVLFYLPIIPRMTIVSMGRGWSGPISFLSHTPPWKICHPRHYRTDEKKKKYIYIYIYGNISEITVTLDKYS